jgi:hypothetical protein
MCSDSYLKLRKSLVLLLSAAIVAIAIPTHAIQRPYKPSCPGQQTAKMIQAESWKSGNVPGIMSPSKTLFVYTSGKTFRCGEKIEVFVGGNGFNLNKANVAFFRMGNYLGSEMRKVKQVSGLTVPLVRAPITNEATGYYAENSKPILVQQISPTWAPGLYLVGVQIQGKSTSKWVFQPFVISAMDSPRVLVAVGTMTTAAYSKWGGKSLYTGVDRTASSRATTISLRRPVSVGSIRSLAAFANASEKHEYSIGYIQDLDLDLSDTVNDILDSPPSVLVFPEHSEYFTLAMRKNLESIIDAGVNVAFLSANSIHWPTTINRNSKTGAVSSLYVNKRLGTFRQAGMYEQSIVGQGYVAYDCYPTDLQLPDPRNWLFEGIAESTDFVTGRIIGGEVDEFNPILPAPDGVQILAATPVSCNSTNAIHYATVTQYAASSGAGVLSIGSTAFICSLSTFCNPSDPDGVILANQLLGNIIAKTNHGPAGVEMTRDVTSVVIGQSEATEPNLDHS